MTTDQDRASRSASTRRSAGCARSSCTGPDRELDRLTPDNVAELLFDDVLWADRARREHDEFVEVLVSHGVRVHLFADLLAQALATDAGRRFAVARVCTDQRFGPTAARELRRAVLRHRPGRCWPTTSSGAC